MFLSEPICVLKAGHTVDGRVIEQNIIDEIAATYNPKKFTARCNEDHFSWGSKLGSVMRVEARDDELWAVVKPNSRLLQRLEQGQLLHTSVEFQLNFANTGKAYLTGLAFTDNPASLGTTQISLSAKDTDKIYAQSGLVVDANAFGSELEQEETLLQKLSSLLKGTAKPSTPFINEDEEIMKEAIAKQGAQITALTASVSTLVTALAAITEPTPTPVPAPQPEPTPTPTQADESELKTQVEALSAELSDLKNVLSKTLIEPEKFRKLAGEDAEPEMYY